MNEPIRIGLAGLGRAGWGMHCEELTGKESQFQIVAACDPIESRRQLMYERYSCKVYETMEELVADPNVELVDITTRSVDHYQHGMLALTANKHVFMEKPLSITYDEALQLQEAAVNSCGDLFVRHNRRFDKDFLHVREIIASGTLGDIFEIKLCRHGFSRRDDWQTIKEFGGGQLLNWGPHIIDHALQLLEHPTYTIWSDLKLIAAVGDSEDHIKIVFKGDNGRIIDLEISGGVAMSSPEYAVYGSRGSLLLTGNQITLKYLDQEIELTPKSANPGTPGETFGSVEALVWKEETIPVNPSKSYNIWDELYKAIREGSEFPIQLSEAVEVMKVISEVKRGTKF